MQIKSIESKLIYRNYKNKLTTIIRFSQKKYYADKFDSLKENIKGTWKMIEHDASMSMTHRHKGK